MDQHRYELGERGARESLDRSTRARCARAPTTLPSWPQLAGPLPALERPPLVVRRGRCTRAMYSMTSSNASRADWAQTALRTRAAICGAGQLRLARAESHARPRRPRHLDRPPAPRIKWYCTSSRLQSSGRRSRRARDEEAGADAFAAALDACRVQTLRVLNQQLGCWARHEALAQQGIITPLVLCRCQGGSGRCVTQTASAGGDNCGDKRENGRRCLTRGVV